MMSPLSPRLAAVAAHVLRDAPVADIGTDHALLPCHLVASGAVSAAIASDVSPRSAAKARETVSRLAAGLRQRVQVRIGDGLAVLAPGEVRTVVIAGMGGETIRRILASGAAHASGVQRLVLSPKSHAVQMRRALVSLGWADVAGVMVQDRAHFYPVVAWERGTTEWSDLDLQWGRCLRADSSSGLTDFLRHETVRLRAAVEAIRAGRGAADAKAVAIDATLAQIAAEIRRRTPHEP
jgi:tRNA (adenine22-N1)-methyltransferase